MKLYLIRHAESEHNIAQVYAGVTDSALTNHGVFQISRLAQHFQSHSIRFSHVFSSPLQRARLTAEGISRTCSQSQPIIHQSLVEKNFGFLEGQSWHGAAQRLTDLPLDDIDDLEPQESAGAMVRRATEFINDCLMPLLVSDDKGEEVVAVVSHGIALSVLWDTLINLCRPVNGVQFFAGIPVDQKIGWANTGYLQLDIRPVTDAAASDPTSWHINVLTVNGLMHLQNTQRTRGGIGSSKYDKSQSRLDAFFSGED